MFGDLDAWIWGRSDGGDARSGVDIYAICFFRSGFRVVVAAPDCVAWSGGDDAATGGEGVVPLGLEFGLILCRFS